MEENMGILDRRGIEDVRKGWKMEAAVKSRRGYVGEMGYHCEGRRGLKDRG